MQTCRQRIDVCALGLLCVPQPHGDQTQPVVATPELGDGRLLCSCRSCPSLRLRGRSSFRLSHRADLCLTAFRWSGPAEGRIRDADPRAQGSAGGARQHQGKYRVACAIEPIGRQLRWPTTTDVKVAIESRGSSPTSAEAQRRRLAQGLAGSPVTCLPRGTRDATARGARGLDRVALPVCFGAGC